MIYGMCQHCRRYKFFVKKRSIKIPGISAPAISKMEMCRGCLRKIEKALPKV